VKTWKSGDSGDSGDSGSNSGSGNSGDSGDSSNSGDSGDSGSNSDSGNSADRLTMICSDKGDSGEVKTNFFVDGAIPSLLLHFADHLTPVEILNQLKTTKSDDLKVDFENPQSLAVLKASCPNTHTHPTHPTLVQYIEPQNVTLSLLMLVKCSPRSQF
jgi:hypothetical protein